MQKKILATILLVLILSMVGTYIFLIEPLRTSLYNQCYDLLSNSASVIASGCSDLITATEQTSASLFWFDEVFEILDQDNTQNYRTDYLTSLRQVQLLTGNILPDHRILSIGIYDRAGTLRSETITALDHNEAQETEWLKKAREAAGGCVWTPVYNTSRMEDYTVPVPVVSMYRALTNPNTFQFAGAVRITLEASAFAELFSEHRSDTHLRAYLINAAGELILSASEEIPVKADVNIQEGVMPSDLAADESLAKSLNIVIKPLAQGNQYVVIWFSDAYYTAQLPLINTIQMMLVLIGGTMLALSVIGSFSLSRPARRLRDEMAQVAAGNLDIRAQNCEGKDEISALGAQFNRMMDTMQLTMKQLDEARTKELEIRLEALQAQINPHFLFNTLDNMRWMSLKHGDSQTAEYMVTFSRLLHRSVDFTPFSLLKDEMQFAQDYIDLEKTRFGDRLDYHAEVASDALLSLPVPAYLLQPMLENSIVHGFLDKTATHTICVFISVEGDTMTIDISDNGAGSNQAERIQAIIDGDLPPAHVMAMENLAERIRLYFGANTSWGVQFHSKANHGARILIMLPATRNAYAKWLS